MRLRLGAGSTALLAGLVLAACGGDERGTPALTGGGEPGQGGELVWAIAAAPGSTDPLAAESPTELLITRQIHEPLIDRLAGPFGDPRRVTGLVRAAQPQAGGTIWSFRLRRGVRFQDGERLNATAVLANATRWTSTAAGRAILPDLITADAPRPDLVRLFLSAPDRRLPQRLADPRLGLVSPGALSPPSGEGAALSRQIGTGTGPFEIRERDSREVVLAKNVAWWGTAARLGPALDLIRFPVEPSAFRRLDLVRAGAVQVAASLPAPQARAARADPLLATLDAPGSTDLAFERSVRGLGSGAQVPTLSRVWLTRVTAAD